jgi:ABC-2 type transport system ATP-binding protein
MIRIDRLTRKFGAVTAVDSLSFETRPGEIFALLGPNGAGKTTTINMILGMLRPDEGASTFQGNPITPDDNAFKSRIGYVPESCALYENLTGTEYLQFVGHLHHLPEDEVKTKAGQMLEAVGLGEQADQLIREYSKGMKQKVLICSALLHDPDLIILDEPFSGLDANAVAVFKELYREQAGRGKTLIFCSHILEVVERLVDRILIIKDGRSLVTGTPTEIIQRTGHASLDKAFNELTGAGDIDLRAKGIAGIIGNNRKK